MIAGLLLAAGMACVADRSAVQARTIAFLDAYARGDRDTVLAEAAPDVVVYGSDRAEWGQGRSALARMYDLDRQLWGRGPVRFGPPLQIAVVASCPVSTVMLTRDFQIGDAKPVPVRFAMTWHWTGGGWRLVQSANSVPTSGQSATELLSR